jgi:hypothetical protein
MEDPWKSLQLAAREALGPLWCNFAKEGRESAVLAPLAQYPNAAAWVARWMALSTDYTTRKLAAMLAGWVHDRKHISILAEMLDRERIVFVDDSLTANSVGEDIMFAATRWTDSRDPQVRNAGIDILASMIRDTLGNTRWNTAHWAVANLHRATGGNHELFSQLISIADERLEEQEFFRNALKILRHNDQAKLSRLIALPSEHQPLSPNDPDYPAVSSLWKAAASAESAPEPLDLEWT